MKLYILIACLCLAACMSQKNTTAQFKTHYLHSRPGKITIVPNTKIPTFEVFSEFGIGKGAIELLEGDWPNELIIRVHTKGLEGFDLFVGDTQHEKFDLEVEAVNDKAKMYFEVTISRSFIPSDTKEIHFQWVDFYR